MKIGVIGAKGFIGREIYNQLPDSVRSDITHTHWNDSYYDVIIDANGSSMKHLAESDPKHDFDLAVHTVMNHVNELNYGKYIYISSIDAEIPGESHYGFNRKLSERIVKYYCPEWTIIRLCSVIGENMVKGIVHDILLGEKIFVAKDSLIQVIPVKEVAKKIMTVLDAYNHGVLRFYSKGSIKVSKICKMFGKSPIVNPDAQKQLYDYDPSDLGFKTPEEYLKETIHERVV